MYKNLYILYGEWEERGEILDFPYQNKGKGNQELNVNKNSLFLFNTSSAGM